MIQSISQCQRFVICLEAFMVVLGLVLCFALVSLGSELLSYHLILFFATFLLFFFSPALLDFIRSIAVLSL